MKKLTTFTLTLASLIGITIVALAQQSNTPQLGKDPMGEVIKAMTLEEKVSLLVGPGLYVPGNPFPGMPTNPTPGQKKVVGAAGAINGIPRLGIPSVIMCDGPAGVHAFNIGTSRVLYATAWPVGTLLASSWDTALVKKVGAAYGKEAKEYGIDIILGPGMNIHRNPLGGRNFEYYSEDPVVTGNIAAAMVNGVQSNGVGVSAKHFFANNNETNRMTANVIASERALREIYLKGWEIMVKKSNPWTIMTSYNLVNGPYTSQNPELVNTILRKEWSFKGYVVTDWGGGNNAVEQMKARNNLIMPGNARQVTAIIDAVKAGQLEEKIIDENVADLLNVTLLTPSFKNYKYSDSPNLKVGGKLSREAATEGMVLLKNNDNTVPIQPLSSVALFGMNGYEIIVGGTGSGEVNKMYTVSLNEGLFNAGFNVQPELQLTYKKYLDEENLKHPKKSMFEEFMNPTPPITEYVISDELISRAVVSSDRAIISIGRNSGEGADRKLEGDYLLTTDEKSMIKRVAVAFHSKNKKVTVVLNIPAPVDVMPWRDDVDAILLAWQPGQEGGNAIADVLSGKVNPSGKLASTFPANYNDDPTAKNFPGKEFRDRMVMGGFGQKMPEAEVTYEEGVYVGYRYYTTFNVKPAYEFGYGLSYTDFNYSNLKLSTPTFGEGFTASVTVTNSGKVAGKEVVQLYISAPTNKLDKPSSELKAFAKTNLLKPGESQTFKFMITAKDLASYQTKITSWVADAGTYTVKIGTSENTKLSTSFKLPKEIVVEKTNKVLVPKVAVNELKPVAKKSK